MNNPVVRQRDHVRH